MATVANGQSTYGGTASGTATVVTFADRYGYVAVTNAGTATLYVTADGSTPTGSGAGTEIAVPVGATKVVANGLPLWYQSSKVIAKGVNQFGNGNTSSSPASPGMVQSQASLAGQMANPGTTITVIGTGAFNLEGTG